MAAGNGYTKIQSRILETLSDGKPHHRDELLACLGDSEATYRNMACHLVAIRKVLRPAGQDIICELLYRRIHYRHVRLMHSAYDGKR